MSDTQTASPDADPVRQIGVRLKLVRTTLELSQTEFAERLGSSRSAVSEAERGEGISATIILGIATQFPEVNLDWLITGRDEWLFNAAKAFVGDVDAPMPASVSISIDTINSGGTVNIYLRHSAEAAFRQGGAGA